MNPTNPSPVSRRRWQFSLRGLLLVALFVAMGFALLATARRLRQAEATVADYRRQYGILEVSDPTAMQAVALWTGEPNHWRYRVYFPRGRYDICCATSGIPADGLPQRKSALNADFEGIVEISAAAYKDPQDGAWKYALSSQGPQGGYSTSVAMSVAPPDEAMSELGSCVDRSTGVVTATPQQPLVLLRKRIVKSPATTISHSKEYGGILLWLSRTGPWRGDHTTRGF
jgi:hypothetical protein